MANREQRGNKEKKKPKTSDKKAKASPATVQSVTQAAKKKGA